LQLWNTCAPAPSFEAEAWIALRFAWLCSSSLPGVHPAVPALLDKTPASIGMGVGSACIGAL